MAKKQFNVLFNELESDEQSNFAVFKFQFHNKTVN